MIYSTKSIAESQSWDQENNLEINIMDINIMDVIHVLINSFSSIH